ncbi:MAG TPA: alpha/beta fold hydrolase [Burkholderiales bacterium]
MADESLEKLRDLTRFRLSRYLAYGVDYFDIERILERIKRAADWAREWGAEGEARARDAEEALARGSRLSAGELFMRGALLCHFGALGVRGESLPFTDEVNALKAKLYARALPLLSPPGERVDIPFAGASFPGTLRKPAGAPRAAVVMLIPGAGSTKEEFNALEGEFLRRGLATLSIDGPGQGEGVALGGVPHDYERPVAAAIDHLEKRGDVDAGRVGIFGRSLGGYLGARAAAFERRVRSCAISGGVFDLAEVWDFCQPHTHRSLSECLQIKDLAKAREAAGRYTLRALAKDIACPLLVVHGDQDKTAPVSGARWFHEAAGTRDKTLVVYEGGNHVCDNMVYRYRPLVADWTAAKLAA